MGKNLPHRLKIHLVKNRSIYILNYLDRNSSKEIYIIKFPMALEWMRF